MFTPNTPTDSARGPRRRWRFAALATSLLLATVGLAGLSQSANAAVRSHPPAHTKFVPRPLHAAPMANGGPLYNYGGPVQNAPRAYLLFWGWTSDPYGEQSYLMNFLNHVGCTSWLRTVNQYSGAGYCSLYQGAWSDSSAIPVTPTDSQIQSEANSFARWLGVSTGDANVQIVVATPYGHNTSGFGSSYCAYHGVIGGTYNTYTDLPYIPQAGGSCGAGYVTGSSLDGVSIVEGHELAEAITDPELNAWMDPNGNEIGDICAWIGLANTNLNGSYFPTQPLWSNRTNSCVQGS